MCCTKLSRGLEANAAVSILLLFCFRGLVSTEQVEIFANSFESCLWSMLVVATEEYDDDNDEGVVASCGSCSITS